MLVRILLKPKLEDLKVIVDLEDYFQEFGEEVIDEDDWRIIIFEQEGFSLIHGFPGGNPNLYLLPDGTSTAIEICRVEDLPEGVIRSWWVKETHRGKKYDGQVFGRDYQVID